MKSPRKKNADKAAAAGKPLKPKAMINFVDPELQKLFLVDKEKYSRLKELADKASNNLRTFVKTIKGDGFTVNQIKVALECDTPEGEAAVKSRIANDLLAAAYSGADIGTQLQLFMDEPRIAGVDRAKEEGKTDCMKNKAAHPKYDPATPQHKAYMEGYHEEQERQTLKGIGKLDSKAAAANKDGSSRKKPKPAAAKPAAGKGSGKRGRPPKAKTEAEAAPTGTTRLITKAEKEAAAKAKAAAAAPAKPKGDAAPPRPPVTRSGVMTSDKARAEAESFFTKSETKGNA